jgi:hypothetical protein
MQFIITLFWDLNIFVISISTFLWNIFDDEFYTHTRIKCLNIRFFVNNYSISIVFIRLSELDKLAL